MFKIAMKPQVRWPVTVEIPVDGGKTEPQPAFEVAFRLKTDAELDALARIVGDDMGALMREVVVGWDEAAVGDADGKALPFSPKARDRLIDIPYVRQALVRAYSAARLGAREKN